MLARVAAAVGVGVELGARVCIGVELLTRRSVVSNDSLVSNKSFLGRPVNLEFYLSRVYLLPFYLLLLFPYMECIDRLGVSLFIAGSELVS